MRVESFRKEGDTQLNLTGKPPKRQISWGKVIYLSLLAAAVFFGGRWLIMTILFINGDGVLDARSSAISSTVIARIDRVHVKQNDSVRKGDLLVTLNSSDIEVKVGSLKRDMEVAVHAIAAKMTDANGQIATLTQEKTNAEADIKDLTAERDNAKKLVDSGALPSPDYFRVAYSLNTRMRDKDLIEIKIKTLAEKLQQMEKEKASVIAAYEAEQAALRRTLELNSLTSPRDGVVSKVFMEIGEVVKPGEPILLVSDSSENYVKTFFHEANENKVHVDDTVSVTFENGEEYSGRVAQIYVAALPIPQEFKRESEPVRSALVVEIVPINQKGWKNVLGSRARISLRRRW